ncbi:MAG: hypothetical protein ACRC67_07235 [Inquilinus sp.]|uniref:hypothetical protein n=1 Tax=Inquilinus sp. TaxID=1932117 RepID=UPI003F2CF9EC
MVQRWFHSPKHRRSRRWRIHGRCVSQLGPTHERGEYDDLAEEDRFLLKRFYNLMEEIKFALPSLNKLIAIARCLDLYSFDMENGIEIIVEYYPAIGIVEQIVLDAEWMAVRRMSA